MPAWWVIPGAVKGVGSILNYASARRNKMPKFSKTPYGQYLRETGETGVYTPEVKSRILGETYRTAGNIAQGRTATTRGYLASRGLLGSIAGARALDQPALDVQTQLGEQAGRLGIKNELSKRIAKEQYVRMLYENELARKGESRADTRALIGGLAGAGVSAYQDYQIHEQEQYERELEAKDIQTMNTLRTIQILLNSSNPKDKEKARKMIEQMGM